MSGMQRVISGAVAAGLCVFTAKAEAHIKMLKPTPWVVEDDGFAGVAGGNPQKSGPCGPSASEKPMLTSAVTTFQAGETITVEWNETVDHPGYFRIALAENRADLKDPTVPFTDMNNCNVDHSKVPKGAHDNVLADGILLQETGGAARPGHPNYSYQVTLPNKPCDKCTLQLIQFMENHPPSCIYYHCADIKIVAAGSDAGVSSRDAGATSATDAGGAAAADSGSSGTGSTGGSASPGNATGGTANADAGSAAGGSASGGADAGALGTTTTGTLAPEKDDDGGCSVSLGRRDKGANTWPGLLLLGLAWLGLRRGARSRRRES